jgi:hypothetical protein
MSCPPVDALGATAAIIVRASMIADFAEEIVVS